MESEISHPRGPTAPRYLRGVPGKLTVKKRRDRALVLLQMRRKFLAIRGFVPRQLTYAKIALAVGVCHCTQACATNFQVFSPTTIMNWDKLDMSDQAIWQRMMAKAPVRNFSYEEERILVGWVLYNDLAMMSTTTAKFREFCFNYFGKTLSPSYIRCVRRKSD